MMIFVRVFAIAFLTVLAFIGGRLSASNSAFERSNQQVAFVQANKVRQYLAAFRSVQADLENGCSQSAKEKVGQGIETSMMFLAEHVQAFPDGVLVTMLKTQDRELLEQLRGQTVDWNQTYPVPECVPSNPMSST